MATPRGAVEAYMDVSPMEGWDRDKWDEYDHEINNVFHRADVFLTPLLNYVAMVPGADTWITGRELLGRHANHNEIGLRQRYIDAMYVDSREKKLVANKRYGGKVQLWEFDELVSRFGQGSPTFMLNVLRQRMGDDIVQVHENIARDAIFKWSLFKFLADGSKWTAGTADFSTITATSDYQMSLQFVMDTRLRMVERSSKYTQRWGTWAAPVPNFPNDSLIMVTPNIMYDLWNLEEGEWMQDLRQLQDDRIINGGQARWRGATFTENPDLVLWNAGILTKQIGVIQPINFGDGAPDPDVEDAVDQVYFVGQSTATQVHYVQCSDFDAGDFVVGDRLSIHIQRTTTWGITDGNDFLDGKTYVAEVWEVDATLNRLKFCEPVVTEFINSFTGTPNGGSEATLYAYITKARHIHPILVVGARGMATFASRTRIRIHNPEDHADLPGVIRTTWDEYGEANRWNPYIYECIFCAASDTRSGRDAVALR